MLKIKASMHIHDGLPPVVKVFDTPGGALRAVAEIFDRVKEPTPKGLDVIVRLQAVDA